jgi:outer membrane protein OmpA-like peptidoglycan-associated protein
LVGRLPDFKPNNSKKMRILSMGFVFFVIWCFVSAWLYNDHLLPAMRKPITLQTIPEKSTREADSLMKLKASMPQHLLIYFEFNGSKFKPDPQTDNSISSFKTWLEKYPQSMLSVSGHTDLVGTAEYNNKLALKRALVVSKYIEEKGINVSRMITASKGSTEPAADYLTAEGRAKNRRTEISIKMQ